MSQRSQFEAYRDADSITIAELDVFFDQLDPMAEADMLGEWRGGCFNTGHSGEAQLSQFNWCGKRFDSRTDVEPMLCADADGKVTANPVLGAAQLRSVEYRGVVTATMVYDSQPVFDHFRKIDEEYVLGVMDRKGDDQSLYFYLRRHS